MSLRQLRRKRFLYGLGLSLNIPARKSQANMATQQQYDDVKIPTDTKSSSQFVEDVESERADGSITRERKAKFATGIDTALYEEALEKYGEEGSIDPEVEKKLVRYVHFSQPEYSS